MIQRYAKYPLSNSNMQVTVYSNRRKLICIDVYCSVSILRNEQLTKQCNVGKINEIRVTVPLT
jgi:hypothetical protein